MAFIPRSVIQGTTHKKFEFSRDARSTEPMVHVRLETLGKDVLEDILNAAKAAGEKKVIRLCEYLLSDIGRFDAPIPSFDAFYFQLRKFLETDLIDGWLYEKQSDGSFLPFAITKIHLYEPNTRDKEDSPAVKLTLKAVSFSSQGDDVPYARAAEISKTIEFSPGDVVRRRVFAILGEHNLVKETEELKADYLDLMHRFAAEVAPFTLQQFRPNETSRATIGRWGKSIDLTPSDRLLLLAGQRGENVYKDAIENVRATESPFDEDSTDTPVHPMAVFFSLKTHNTVTCQGVIASLYQYDKSLKDKLVLPQTHRDLLDVLTADIDVLAADFIEGKSAGNIILTKGLPGVGKTLTAEVYSELTETPLYKIHTGNLGTTPSQIEKSLQVLFARSLAWNCALLLDEADVFVMRRGNDIIQNAIVAEFLRALEYFSGLMFLTTNRVDLIDDAIVSRCAAIITYEPPKDDQRRKVWNLFNDHFKANLTDELIGKLITMFPTISPRDIKMLLRLTLRVAAHHGTPVTLDAFRQCAMFRAVDITEAA